MAVLTDLTIIAKDASINTINPALISDLILQAMENQDALTFLGEMPHFDKQVNMRFVQDAMIARIPLFLPSAEGLHICEANKAHYNARTPTIYYALGHTDPEGFEKAHVALQNADDFVTVSLHHDQEACDFLLGIGKKLLELSDKFRVFYRTTDIDNSYKEL